MHEDEGLRQRHGRPVSPATRRLAVAAIAAVIAVIDLAVKAWAERGLPVDGIEGGPVDLRLGFNTGVAFSFGAGAPPWAVVGMTGAITVALAVVAWRLAGSGGRGPLAALALVLGGAGANLIDRAADGRVTDYLYTGWWPTFNLADVAIVSGGVLLAVVTWRASPVEEPAQKPAAAESKASGPNGSCD